MRGGSPAINTSLPCAALFLPSSLLLRFPHRADFVPRLVARLTSCRSTGRPEQLSSKGFGLPMDFGRNLVLLILLASHETSILVCLSLL